MSTAADRFRRLLLLLPRFAQRSTHSITDLARLLGVSEETVIADIQSLPERYDLAGFTERVCLCLDGDEVIVNTDHLLRPMRLSAAECHVLELGLSLLAQEGPPEHSAALERLRGEVRELIAALPQDDAYAGIRGVGLGAHGDGVLTTLRTALRRARVVAIRYQGSGDGEAHNRRVRPWAVVHGLGRWYLVGWCERNGGERVFRVDRVLEAEVTDDASDRPDDFDLDAVLLDGVPWVTATPPPACRVWYSPSIARWIAERHGTPLEPDGSIIREMPMADREWLIRHVLQYGPDARILEPVAVQEELVERVRAVGGGPL